MVKILQRLKGFLPTQRRLIQLYTALLYNAHVKGFVQGDIYTGTLKMTCVPGLNCYSCPGAVGGCPLGALQNAVASSGSRAPTYILGILMLYGLMLGRTICGFLCPFGLLQELLHKLSTPKIRKGRTTRWLSYIKYALLILLVIVIPLLYSLQSLPLPAFCKYICPAGTLEGAVGLLSHPDNADKYPMLGLLFTRKMLILLAVIAACIFLYRAFCRFLCPLGAIYGLFSKVAVIGVRVEANKCIDCGRCIRHCKMDIRKVGDHECIHCTECIDACPTGAITFRAGRVVLCQKADAEVDKPQAGKRRRKLRRIGWGMAMLLLVIVLIVCNVPDKAADTKTENPVDSQVTDFIVPLYGADDYFRLSDCVGKKVVINFWATWCTPCCEELPYFNELYEKYSDTVEVIAIHSELLTDDVPAYLAQYDYTMPFALDDSGDVARAYGVSIMLPHTVILDENGEVIYNAAGSLTLAELEQLLQIEAAPTATPVQRAPDRLIRN